MNKFIFVSILACILTTNSLLARPRTLPLSEIVGFADVIVRGWGNGKYKISIDKVFKGPKKSSIQIMKKIPAKFDGGERKVPNWSGIFFLRTNGGKFIPLSGGWVRPKDKADKVEEVLGMYSNIGSYVSDPAFSHSIDLIDVIRNTYKKSKIRCIEYPHLSQIFESSLMPRSLYAKIPWEHKGVVSLRCEYDYREVLMIKVISAEGDGEMAAFMSNYIELKSQAIRNNQTWIKDQTLGLKSPPIPFTLSVDLRWPEDTGSTKADDVLDFLLSNIDHDKVSHIALTALKEIRAERAMEQVVAQLRRKCLNRDRDLITYRHGGGGELSFLQASKDPRAIPVICEIFDSIDDPELGRNFIGRASTYLWQTGSKEEIHCVRRTMERGIGISSLPQVLAMIGTIDEVQFLIDMVNKYPEKSSVFVNAFRVFRFKSNKGEEPWMKQRRYPPDSSRKLLNRWLSWWNQNIDDFKIVRDKWEKRREDYERKQVIKRNGRWVLVHRIEEVSD